MTHVLTNERDAKDQTVRIQQAMKRDLPLLSEMFVYDSITSRKRHDLSKYMYHCVVCEIVYSYHFFRNFQNVLYRYL